MSFSTQASDGNQRRRPTFLNPHAAEFVPSSLRSPSVSTPSPSPSSGKQVVDPSDDHDYWQQQLPDDITPDFHDEHPFLSHQLDALSLNPSSSPSGPANALPYSPLSMYGGGGRGGDAPSSTTNPWDMNLLASDHSFVNPAEEGEGPSFTQSGDAVDNITNPVEFLASHFPGFALDSLAEVYFANSCDLNLTFDMLTQLELQVEGVTKHNMNVKTISAPTLTSTDFPSLPIPEPENKTNFQKYAGDQLPYGSFDKDNLFLFKSNSSLNAKTSTDFASAVRKLASQDSGFWKYDKNGSPDAAIGSSRTSHALTGLYSSAAGRSFSDKTKVRASARAAPAWLETGDAVANLYSDVREEARDRARIRNTYFEQARQAYLIGNKALAKELSVKGHLHNMQMKAAHCKAGESIYRERNPVSPGLQGPGRCQEKMIDLHGLHVNEAIHVLKQELNVLRNAARLSEQRLHVYICVGTGHHTRGSRTPARLPIAVQRYLLQEEGLDYSEPQAGLLRVVLF